MEMWDVTRDCANTSNIDALAQQTSGLDYREDRLGTSDNNGPANFLEQLL